MKKNIISCVITIGIMLGTASSGFSLSYTETSDGELSQIPTTMLMFDLGLNTIEGSIYFDNRTGLDSDRDSFAFNLVSGMAVNSITLAFELTEYYDDEEFNWKDPAVAAISDYTLDGGTPQRVDFLTSLSPISLFTGQIIGEGDHTFTNSNLVVAIQDMWKADYTLTFDVGTAPVPEPTTMLLLGSGLLGLAGFRRKFKKG